LVYGKCLFVLVLLVGLVFTVVWVVNLAVLIGVYATGFVVGCVICWFDLLCSLIDFDCGI